MIRGRGVTGASGERERREERLKRQRESREERLKRERERGVRSVEGS